MTDVPFPCHRADCRPSSGTVTCKTVSRGDLNSGIAQSAGGHRMGI
jgi:hypothetical protein